MLEKQSLLDSGNILFLAFNTACHKGMGRHYWNEQEARLTGAPACGVS